MTLDVTKAFMHPMEKFPFETEALLEKQDVNGDEVTFEPVKMKGTFCKMDEETIRLEGWLKTTVHAPCALCLESTAAEVEVEFAETFRKDANEEEDECFRYENRLLPLDHMTLTLVLLNMPMRFQCTNDCTGGMGLTAWDEEKTVWAENEEQSQGTYRPFEGLQQMLDEGQKNQ